MQRNRPFCAVCGVVLVGALTLCAGPAVAQEEGTEVSGSVVLDKRFLVSDWWASEPSADTPQVGFFSKADLKLQRRYDDLRVVVSGQLRFYDYSGVKESDDLFRAEAQSEFEFLPWEVFIEAHGVFVDGLDLKMGKQRIAWGRADKLNPTDVLNPDDFSDIFDFGAHVPSTAAVASYTFENDMSITGVWLPSVRPVMTSYAYPQVESMVTGQQQKMLEGALMPPGSSSMPIELAPGINKVNMPLFDVRHSMQAVKLDGSFFGVDLSVSYFNGYEDIPVVKEVMVQLGSEVSVDTVMGFMAVQQVGFDMATDLWGVGFWAEAAVVIPEGVKTKVCSPLAEGPVAVQTVSDSPFVKFTVGADYTFPGGFYTNIQYAHGLAHEIDAESVGEYIVGRFHKKFLNDKIQLALNGGYAVPEWSQAADQYGFLINPEFSYKPFDAFELIAGLQVVEGEGAESLFSSLDAADQLYFRAKATF